MVRNGDQRGRGGGVSGRKEVVKSLFFLANFS